MSKISLSAKELKESFKFLTTLADSAVLTDSAIVLSQTEEEKPRVALTLVNDYVQAQYFFRKSMIHEKLKPFVFDPRLISRISPNQEMVHLSWSDSATLFIEDGRLKSNLKVGLARKFEGYHPVLDIQTRVPGALLEHLLERCVVPGVYHKIDIAQQPMRIYGQKGNLCGSFDDAFSVMQVETDAPFSDNIDLQIPRFVADALCSIDLAEEETVGIGQNGFQIIFTGKYFSLSCTGLVQDAIELQTALKEQGAVNVTLHFDPKILADAVKPLVKLIPAKDTSGAYLVATFNDGQMSISMRHSEIGDATSENIPGLKDMYIEKGLRSTHAHLHPVGFHAYTQLLGTPLATMEVFPKAVQYKCQEAIVTPDGRFLSTRSYLFPSVEV
jgi:hypothetical protein